MSWGCDPEDRGQHVAATRTISNHAELEEEELSPTGAELKQLELKQAPVTVDFSHQNCERMNFDLCESFVT